MVLPLLILRMKRTDEMSETQQFKNFRIWAAVGVALLYLVLAASGNA
jgi:heme A synthase